MSLSQQFRAQLESVESALATCEAILNPASTKEQEVQDWLEEYSAWAD